MILATSIPPTLLPRIPFTLELIMSDFVSGDDRNEINNVLSLQTYGLSFSNQLTYVQNSDTQNIFTGALGVSSHVSGLGLRGIANYDLQPTSEVTTVDLTLRPPLYRNYQLTFGLNHSLRADLTEISAAASKSVGSFNLSLGARYNTDSVVSPDARLSIGLGRKPRENRWVPHALSIAGRGSVICNLARTIIATQDQATFAAEAAPTDQNNL